MKKTPGENTSCAVLNRLVELQNNVYIYITCIEYIYIYYTYIQFCTYIWFPVKILYIWVVAIVMVIAFGGALSLSRVLWKWAYSRSNMKPKSIPKQARTWIDDRGVVLLLSGSSATLHVPFMLHLFACIFLHFPFMCTHLPFTLYSCPLIFLHSPFMFLSIVTSLCFPS